MLGWMGMRCLCFLVASIAVAQTPTPTHQAPRPAIPAKSTSTAAKPTPKTAPQPMTDEQKTIYALGLSFYRSIGQFNFSPAELALVERAMSDAAAGKPAVDLDQWGPKIQGLAQQRVQHASEAYLTKAAAEPGAVKTPSGLVYHDVAVGTGPSPKATDTVKVNYRGTFVDGTEFDNSYKRNEPAQFALNGVIPCWTEGVQRMKVGGKAKLVCPASIAYGERGRPGIPPGATLVFDIELLAIPSPAPAGPGAPASAPNGH
jgi:FKBP-type peptidyl-prolyl cis-trans isomerase FkpA